MESSTIVSWLAKVGFWVTLALLAIGIYTSRSLWWLVGFGLFWLSSLSLLAKCRMPSSAVFSLILCDIYFIVVLGVIVSNKDASAWWLTIALLLEITFIGYAQNQIDEEKKKQAQEAAPEESDEENEDEGEEDDEDEGEEDDEDEGEEDDEDEGEERKPEKEVAVTEKTDGEIPRTKSTNGEAIATKTAEEARESKHRDLEIAAIREAFARLTKLQLYHIVLNSGSSADDIRIAKDLLTERNASDLLNQINKK